MLSDWLGMQVEVVEFAGAWLPLPPDQRTRLSVNGAWCRLGVDAAAGVRAWDPQARIVLRVGPLDLRASSGCCRTGSRCTGWSRWCAPMSVSSRLRHQSGPRRPPGASAAVERRRQIHRHCWAGTPGCRVREGGYTARGDAADAVFEAEVIEAQRVDWRKPETWQARHDRQGGDSGMSGWGGGYVTDVPYMTGYYRHQSPRC